MTVGVKKAGKDNVLGLTCLANLFTAFFVFAFLPPKVTDVLAFSGHAVNVLEAAVFHA